MVRRLIKHSKTSVIPTIILINIIVFVLWQFLLDSSPQFMLDHFLVSWKGLTQGRVWTLVTSMFSHNMFFHLLINVYVFFGFGLLVENVLGSKRFTLFYFLAGILGSFSHAAVSNFILSQPETPALGASGAVAGVIILYSFIYPKNKILFLGLIPIPAFWGALFFIGLDIWGLVAQSSGGGFPIGHGAHLGGALAGLIYYFTYVCRIDQDIIK